MAQEEKGRFSKLWTRGIIALIVGGLILLAALSVPPGINMNLAEIGKGKPALVFVYDPNLSVSASQVNEMNEIRDLYSDTVLFLIADIGVPDAQALVRQYQADAASLLVFSADGALLARARGLLEADELSDLLRDSLPAPQQK